MLHVGNSYSARVLWKHALSQFIPADILSRQRLFFASVFNGAELFLTNLII